MQNIYIILSFKCFWKICTPHLFIIPSLHIFLNTLLQIVQYLSRLSLRSQKLHLINSWHWQAYHHHQSASIYISSATIAERQEDTRKRKHQSGRGDIEKMKMQGEERPLPLYLSENHRHDFTKRPTSKALPSPLFLVLSIKFSRIFLTAQLYLVYWMLVAVGL